MGSVVLVLTVVGVLGTGLMAGVFYAFSGFVMPALKRLPAAQGIAAMQSINVTAVRAALMTALFGTAAVCVALIVCAARAWDRPFALLMLVGAVVYLVGVVGWTIGFHVPLNNALDRLEPGAGGAAETWAGYLRRWGAGNQARWLTSLAASALFTIGLVVGA